MVVRFHWPTQSWREQTPQKENCRELLSAWGPTGEPLIGLFARMPKGVLFLNAVPNRAGGFLQRPCCHSAQNVWGKESRAAVLSTGDNFNGGTALKRKTGDAARWNANTRRDG